MTPIKQILQINDVDKWQGTVLALHEDGSFSQLDLGVDEHGPAIKVIPVTLYGV